MHELQVAVGSELTLQPLGRVLGVPVLCQRDSELAALPVPASSIAKAARLQAFNWPDLDQQPEGGSIVEELSPFLAIVRESDAVGDLALILTQYWGGSGTQAALLFHDGAVVWGPALGPGAVNEALRRIGVVARPGSDEWDTVGLTGWRSTEELSGSAGS